MERLKERKMKLPTFLLQWGSEDWWTFHVARAGVIVSISWEEFRKVFQNKFYPCSLYHTKKNGFISLVQGDMIVVMYEKMFTEFTKYVLAFVIDEADKCKHFENSFGT